MLIVLGMVGFPEEFIARMRSEARTLANATVKDAGCVAYDVSEDLCEPGVLRFSEIWSDGAAMARHLETPHVANWRAACAASGVRDRRFTSFEANESKPF